MNKQTTKATKTRSLKKDKQEYLYQQLFRKLLEEFYIEDDLCDRCRNLRFCGSEKHPTTHFLARTLSTLGYPTPSQVEKLGLEPHNTNPKDIDLKVWDKKQVQRVIDNKNSRPEFSLADFYSDD